MSLTEVCGISAEQAEGSSVAECLKRKGRATVDRVKVEITEAGLSFLGLGIRPPMPSWGQMLGQAGQWWIYYWHVFVFPSMAILISVLAFQGLADGLQRAIDFKVNV